MDVAPWCYKWMGLGLVLLITNHQKLIITTVVKIIFDVKLIQISLGSGGEGREEEINHHQVEFSQLYKILST